MGTEMYRPIVTSPAQFSTLWTSDGKTPFTPCPFALYMYSRGRWKCETWTCGTWKCGTMLQGWKMRYMNLRHQLTRVEIARHENARNAIVWNTECCIGYVCPLPSRNAWVDKKEHRYQHQYFYVSPNHSLLIKTLTINRKKLHVVIMSMEMEC